MSARSFGTLGRLARYFWGFKLTAEGKWLVAGIFACATVALSSLDIPPYWLLCALCGVATGVWTAAWLMRPVATLSGALPGKAAAGRPVTGEFRVGNPLRRPLYDLYLWMGGLPNGLEVVEPERSLANLEPGGEALMPLTLHPKRRGLYVLPPLSLCTTFPLHLFRTRARIRNDARAVQADSLLVLPSFTPVAGIDLPISARYQPGGIALSSHVGESPEYIGNREYRPGDALRFIDHRSWARLARPIVREFQEEYYCRIALVLDTFVPGNKPPPPEGFRALEAAVSLAASAADALARGEYIIDIFAAGPELYVFRAGRHTAHFDNVLEILACVDACRENPFSVVTPALADELANVSCVLGVFLDWDASREGLARAAVEAGCSVKVFIVRDGDTSRPLDGFEGAQAVVQYPPEAVENGGIEVL